MLCLALCFPPALKPLPNTSVRPVRSFLFSLVVLLFLLAPTCMFPTECILNFVISSCVSDS